jgi:hypothetical protein
MIDVSDNGYIPDFLHYFVLPIKKKAQRYKNFHKKRLNNEPINNKQCANGLTHVYNESEGIARSDAFTTRL